MNNSDRSAAIITGGGRGLGKVIAHFLSRTHNVLIIGRTESDLISTCESIKKNNNTAEYLVGDIADPSTAVRVVAKVNELGWNISVLINNAGIGKSSVTHEVDLQVWQNIISTNLDGSFYLTREVLPLLLQNDKGTIIFISSTAGLEGYSHEAAYVSSKHAQVGLSKVVAKEYGKDGITSVALCAGFIDGEMTDRTIHGVMERRNVTFEEAYEIVASKNPQGRILSAEEVAGVTADICNEKFLPQNGEPIVFEGTPQ